MFGTAIYGCSYDFYMGVPNCHKKKLQTLVVTVPNISIFSFRTDGSFFYEHPSFVTRSCNIIHSEHALFTLRISVRFFSEHPLEDLSVNSEHPVSKTDVRNDRDETSGGPIEM
jgi:hypothetical protein